MHNQISQLAAEVHESNKHWWMDPISGKPLMCDKSEKLFLIISEIIEAGEGVRKDLMDDHLPHRRMVEVEMADAVIRFLDYVGYHKIDIDKVYRELYPDLHDKSLNGLVRYFANRYYKRGDNKAKQLMLLVRTVSQIDILEGISRPLEDEIEYRSPRVEQNIALGCGLFLAKVADYCWCWGLDLEGAVKEKREYNLKRADHTNAARTAVGGKKW